MLTPVAAVSETLRVATFHAELTRKGPGLLLRDILRGEDDQLDALRDVVRAVDPDILLLTKVDFDAGERTRAAMQDWLGFPHAVTVAPNSMVPTEFDLDGDGRAGDRQAWVRYGGEGAMLMLSRHPAHLQYHLNDRLWADVDAGTMPVDKSGAPFLNAKARQAITVVTQGLWVVRVTPPLGDPVELALFQNQTPVFDGSEDLNGRRTLAQLNLVRGVVAGDHGAFPDKRFIVMGNSNLDPAAGQGDRAAMRAFLDGPRWNDPEPRSVLGGTNTAFWDKPGPMRVSYVLPSQDWMVSASGVFWPETGPLRDSAEQASRHRLVWVDIKPRLE